MTSAGFVQMFAAVAVAGRSVIAMPDRRWVEMVGEIGAVAVLVLAVAGRLPLVSPRGPGVGVDDDGTGAIW